jgi:hypothetical protein
MDERIKETGKMDDGMELEKVKFNVWDSFFIYCGANIMYELIFLWFLSVVAVAVVQFANGDMYQGDYVKDQRSGVGKYTWKDGRVYEGRYVESIIECQHLFN